MFVVEITDKTKLNFSEDGLLDIGCQRRIGDYYGNVPKHLPQLQVR